MNRGWKLCPEFQDRPPFPSLPQALSLIKADGRINYLESGPSRDRLSDRGIGEMAGERKFKDQTSAQEEVVRKYFHQVLDMGKTELIEELFHPQCVLHRPGGDVVGIDGARGVAERRKETFSQFQTEILDLFGSGDRLVVRLLHRGVGGGKWRSRLGHYDVTGRAVSWNAIAIFRFEETKIIEEWVTRDELGMILQFGLLKPATDAR